MFLSKKEYQQPVCPNCQSFLLLEQVSLKGKTYQIGADGLISDVNLTPNAPEIPQYQFLICSRCEQSYEIKYDKLGRICRGAKS
ncbi:MAG: hypothetical protein PHX14_07745 [Syntrophomonadaceae bacterium]|nr:hypothetical protein [Syntrophomonadaceae bacterium]